MLGYLSEDAKVYYSKGVHIISEQPHNLTDPYHILVKARPKEFNTVHRTVPSHGAGHVTMYVPAINGQDHVISCEEK